MTPEVTCQHDDHEDCMFCCVCGRCDESLDSEDVCSDCRGPETMARIVCFDFDDTLCYKDGVPNEVMIAKLREHAAAGDVCHVVTARSGRNETQEARDTLFPGMVSVRDFIAAYDLPIAQVFFVNHNPKGLLLQRIGAALHYDDSPDELASAKEHGIEAVDSIPFR